MDLTALPFDDLDPQDAYAAWRLRQDVFVLEQECLYADLDGRDTEPATRHVLLKDGTGEVVGYCRVLSDPETWRIGRVVLRRDARGQGLADRVVRRALEECPGRDVVLDAQAPLAGWYEMFGFARDGEDFVEDGIPHTPMRLRRG